MARETMTSYRTGSPVRRQCRILADVKEREIGGRPLLLLGVLLMLIGVQLVATGVIGELLTRIYHEPQGRPQYLLRRQPRKGS